MQTGHQDYVASQKDEERVVVPAFKSNYCYVLSASLTLMYRVAHHVPDLGWVEHGPAFDIRIQKFSSVEALICANSILSEGRREGKGNFFGKSKI